MAYTPNALSVRVEHDGTLDADARLSTERAIFACYSEIGTVGGTLALSSGRGYGLRLELTLPYDTEPSPRVPSDAATRRVPASSSIGFDAASERLTTQEETTLSLLAAGLSNKEIANAMHLSVGTVKFHLAQIYQKLGVQGRGRGAAVARARELGLLFD
jgi:DNA-binding CsgD family transcriptional regulator